MPRQGRLGPTKDRGRLTAASTPPPKPTGVAGASVRLPGSPWQEPRGAWYCDQRSAAQGFVLRPTRGRGQGFSRAGLRAATMATWNRTAIPAAARGLVLRPKDRRRAGLRTATKGPSPRRASYCDKLGARLEHGRGLRRRAHGVWATISHGHALPTSSRMSSDRFLVPVWWHRRSVSGAPKGSRLAWVR